MADIAIPLEPSLLNSARVGDHTFINLVASVLRDAGHEVQFMPDTVSADALPDHSLVHMTPPATRLGLTFRRAYHYPFWRIEATDRRWLSDVARAEFLSDTPPHPEAAGFHTRWRKRLFGIADVPPRDRAGHVYVPLQGKLTRHRSFQSMSPIDMIETILRLDRSRPVIATLHPKERYTDEDRQALARLRADHPRFSLDTRPPQQHLTACAYVVTQNSAVAFEGFLLDRPAILFARIDFHHIALSLHRMSVEDAFAAVPDHRPPYAAYVHWFWQEMAINAGRPDAADQIALRFRALGWPV